MKRLLIALLVLACVAIPVFVAATDAYMSEKEAERIAEQILCGEVLVVPPEYEADQSIAKGLSQKQIALLGTAPSFSAASTSVRRRVVSSLPCSLNRSALAFSLARKNAKLTLIFRSPLAFVHCARKGQPSQLRLR